MAGTGKKKKGRTRYRIRLVCPPWLRKLLRKENGIPSKQKTHGYIAVHDLPAALAIPDEKKEKKDAAKATSALKRATADIAAHGRKTSDEIKKSEEAELALKHEEELSPFVDEIAILQPVQHRSSAVLKIQQREIRKQTRKTQAQLRRQRNRSRISPKKRQRRKRLTIALTALFSVALMVAAAGIARLWQDGYFDKANEYIPAQEVYFDGIPMGTVRSTEGEKIRESVEKIYEDLDETYGVQLLADQELVLKDALIDEKYISDTQDITDEIRQHITLHTDGIVIDIDGMTAVAVETEEEAEWILDSLIAPYKDLDNLTQIGFVEDVKIKHQNISVRELVSKEEAYQFLLTGAVAPQVYVVQQDDTIWAIAQRFGFTEGEILATNPQLDSSGKIYPGMELTLLRAQRLINVSSTQVFEEKTTLPFETQNLTDDSMYDDQVVVRQQGSDGEMTATIQVDYINGNEAARTVLKEEVTKEPVSKIVVTGTKQRPSNVSAAGYMQPVSNGHITSGFGRRTSPTAGASSYHYGIDIGGVGYGATIVASRAGTVTYAGWSGGYGYMVEIDHGGGVRTRYGHCSKILVSTGQTVNMGTPIALVGSTGVSTGPHLHFEVRINGTAVNPRGYVDIAD